MRTSFSKTLLLFITCLLSFTAYSQCSCTVLSPNTITTVGNYSCVFRGSSITLTVSRPLGDSTLWYTINGTDTVKIGSGTSISYTLDTPRQFLARNVLTCYCTGPTQSTVYSSYVASTSIRFDTTTANIGATFLLVNNDPVICNGTMTDVSVYAVGRTCSLTMTRDNTTNLTQGAATWTGVTNAYRIPLTNTTSSSQVTNVTFTPYLSGCLGTPQKTQVTVLPSPSASNSKCYAPAVPAEYGGAITAWIYRGSKLQLWAGKPSIAVDDREWYQVKGRDTIYKGGGDTLAIAPDSICTYIARNKNYCACGDSTHSIYYSQYALMATISAIQDTSVKPTFNLTYSSTVCSGSPTSIYAYANAKDYSSNIADPIVAFYRDDTANVSGPVTGTFYQTSNIGISLKNKTTIPQRVRFLMRSYPRFGGCWSDDKIIYITVLPDTALPSDPCSAPARPKNWIFLYGDASTYAKGAHIQYSVDTTVTATEVLWYKVVGTDTSYIGSGYTINIIADTSCKYLVRNRNMCSCSGNSFYYSDYLQFANINVVTVSRFINWTPLNYVTTVASGTPFNIVPTGDSAVLGFNLSRDNASISGSTNTAASTTYFSQGQLSAVLTNTTNVPQRVKYTIRANNNGIYYNSYTGYITVLPNSLTVSNPSHCVVPKQHGATYQSQSSAVGSNVIINMRELGSPAIAGAPFQNTITDTVDFIDWYKVRWPGDTTFLGSSLSPATAPVYVNIDTNFRVLTVARNVCLWSDNTIHEYKTGLNLNVLVTAGKTSLPTISTTNNKPFIQSGQATDISFSATGSVNSLNSFRTNSLNISGSLSLTGFGPSKPSILDTLINTTSTPQKVFFISYPALTGNLGGSCRLDSVIVYPPCASWAGLATAIRASKDSICAGDTTVLAADSLPGPAGSTYLWSNGATTRSILAVCGGIYTVTVTSGCGCSTTAIKTIISKAAPVMQATNVTIYSGLSGTLSITGAAGYQWSTGSTSNSISVSVAGIYSVTGTGTNGCKTVLRDTVTMLPDSFTIHASLDTVYSGDTVTLSVDTILGTAVNWFKGACGAIGADYLGNGNRFSFKVDNATTFYARYTTYAMVGDTIQDSLGVSCSSKEIIVKDIVGKELLSSGFDVQWDTSHYGFSNNEIGLIQNGTISYAIQAPDSPVNIGFTYLEDDSTDYDPTSNANARRYEMGWKDGAYFVVHQGVKTNIPLSIVAVKKGGIIQIDKVDQELFYRVNDVLVFQGQLASYQTGHLALHFLDHLGRAPVQIFNVNGIIYPIRTNFEGHYKDAPIDPGQCPSDIDRNWIYNVTYDENGNAISEGKVFYDDLGRKIQTQSVNHTDNIIFASQTIYDAFGRGILQSLPAPTGNSSLCYQEHFITNAINQDYSYNDFDDHTPGSSNEQFPNIVGTNSNSVGYYYSANNTLEPNTPCTSYPYTRTDYYPDLRGIVRQTGTPGNQKRMGTHTAKQMSFAVHELLSRYLAFRNVYVPTSVNGTSDQGLFHKGVMTVSSDQNGNRAAQYSDQQGQVIATANIGPSEDYNSMVPGAFYSTFNLQSDYFEYNALQPSGSNKYVECFIQYNNQHISGLNITQPLYIYDMMTDALVATLSPGSSYSYLPIPSGFYRFESVDNFYLTGLTYNFKEFSYNIYDDAGHMVAQVAPMGTAQPIVSPPTGTPYTKYTNTNTFNTLGWLLSKTTVDEGSGHSVPGTTTYLYGNDGRIRFSQNLRQLYEGKFSYTNYDVVGRPIETGEYDPQRHTTTTPIFQFPINGNVSSSNIDISQDAILNSNDGLAEVGPTNKTYRRSIAYDESQNDYPSAYGKQAFTLGTATKMWNDNGDVSWYSYDENGNLITEAQKSSALGNQKITYSYGMLGNLLSKNSQYSSYTYAYDDDQRIKEVSISHGQYQAAQLQARYSYYKHGPLKRTELGAQTQGIDYTYTIEGWLKSINHPDMTPDVDPGYDGKAGSAHSIFGKDAFGMALDYYEGDYINTRPGNTIGSWGTDLNVANLYNGNIKNMRWNSARPSSLVFPVFIQGTRARHYIHQYQYDEKNQLIQAAFGQSYALFPSTNVFSAIGSNYQENFSYDANGNIQTLNRNAYVDANTNAPGLDMDQLTYHYQTDNNKLAYVDDAVPANTSQQDIKDQASGNYEYDMSGRMIKNAGDGQFVDYDPYGKVIAVYQDIAKTLPRVKYTYNERGYRSSKTAYYNYTPLKTTYYITDASGLVIAIYENNTLAMPGGTSQTKLIEIPIYATGRIGVEYVTQQPASSDQPGLYINSYQAVYELSDHLGNVRVTLARGLAQGQYTVLSAMGYYATGMLLPGMQLNAGGRSYRYGYQGQNAEMDPETGWNDFELRDYDNRLGRWVIPDPYGQYWSPYVAMGNNWVNIFDADGGEDTEIVDDGTYGPLNENQIYASDYVRSILPSVGPYNPDAISGFTMTSSAGYTMQTTEFQNTTFFPSTTITLTFKDFTDNMMAAGPINLANTGDVTNRSIQGLGELGSFTPNLNNQVQIEIGGGQMTTPLGDGYGNQNNIDIIGASMLPLPKFGLFAKLGSFLGLTTESGGLKVFGSLAEKFGPTYESIAVKRGSHVALDYGRNLLKVSSGSWSKIYEAGILNGQKVEVHYFYNAATGEIVNPYIHHSGWGRAFKEIVY